MKRFFVILLLALGLTCPQPATIGSSGDSTSWVTTLSARNKKSDKKKSKKNKRDPKSKKKLKQQSKRSQPGAIVPLIGSLNATAGKGTQALCRVTIPAATACQTINYKAITVYFNRRLRIPLCVAYELTGTMVAMADAPTAEKRRNYKFLTDDNVPGCPSHRDYSGSGYTRGHMAPAMDMRGDRETMRECFYMTNMCPQVAKLNNDNWRIMEEAVHRWARRDGRLIVLTGPIMGNRREHIGPRNDIAVPEAFYKVIYAPQQQRAIAFIYANSDHNGGMARHATTINEVERRTGLDFFTALSRDTESKIEAQCDLNAWK